jgi:hypothetical protein
MYTEAASEIKPPKLGARKPGVLIGLAERFREPRGRIEQFAFDWAHVVRIGSATVLTGQRGEELVRVATLLPAVGLWVIHDDMQRPDLAGVAWECWGIGPNEQEESEGHKR